MAVFRVERTNNYTVMSNYHLRDKTLSLKAKGLLSLMLSLPETWDYTPSGLARISLEGKDAIRDAVVELEKAGYIQRGQTTDKTGKFSGNEYIIREYPTAQAPSPVFPTQINIDKKITDSSNKESFTFPSSPPAPVEEPREAKGRKRERKKTISQSEMDGYRDLIQENICYDDLDTTFCDRDFITVAKEHVEYNRFAKTKGVMIWKPKQERNGELSFIQMLASPVGAA